LIAACLGLVLLLSVVALWWSVPSVGWLRDENPATTAFMDRNRASGASVTQRWVSLDHVSPHVLHAILVAEDIEFFQHRGFSFAEQRAAVRTAMSQGTAPRGASTVTQQLAKNLWLTPERSAWRKLREAALAWKLERTLGKRRILELYVNVVEFGPGTYGVGAAADRYFRTATLWLTPEQAAQLAAGLSRPSLWNPSVRTEGYASRVALIRGRMDRGTFLWRHMLPLYRTPT
jgi:monofunctional biosynthetic peptidoglycan transglycosylase